MACINFLEEAIKENDAAALKHLIKIEYKISEDPQHPLNYSLHFTFTPNEYFENEVLSVNLHIKEPRECTKIEGTEIKWKEGKNLTRKTVQKKQRNKKTGQTRTVTKEEDCDSFFNLFKDCEQVKPLQVLFLLSSATMSMSTMMKKKTMHMIKSSTTLNGLTASLKNCFLTT